MSEAPLRVGDVLYGYCGGFFGRDSYDDKRIEAIGSDWVVCRDDQGRIHCTNFTWRNDGWSISDLEQYRTKPVDDW